MSTVTEESEGEISFGEEEEKINIGLYIGGRNTKGERNGRGWAILPNADQYDGQYRQGRRHGIGLYVFQDGSRYFGQYRCGHRSGRGIFIYPDGSHYEGNWHKNLKHGKGRYYYSNGDTYCGSWYRGLRHGIGIYSFRTKKTNEIISFKGTWRQGVRVGPFQSSFGTEDSLTTLHGTWDNLYPQGPCVFSFNDHYLQTGFFKTPGREANLRLQSKKNSLEESSDLEENMSQEENKEKQDVWSDEPTIWFAQDLCAYNYALLPQEPVPLPISDSDISICSLSTEPTDRTIEKPLSNMGEGEREVEIECKPCEGSTSEFESSSHLDACAIEISTENCA